MEWAGIENKVHNALCSSTTATFRNDIYWDEDT